MQRVAQPPITPSKRDRERHDFWPGLVLALIGLVLLFSGARHMTAVETVDESAAWETQLIKAFSTGGLQLVDLAAPPNPSDFDDPMAAAAAFDRYDRLSQEEKSQRRRYRVDTGASDPCPT